MRLAHPLTIKGNRNLQNGTIWQDYKKKAIDRITMIAGVLWYWGNNIQKTKATLLQNTLAFVSDLKTQGEKMFHYIITNGNCQLV